MLGLLGAALGSAASIGLGYFMAARERQAAEEAKAREEARKQEMSEVAAYTKKGDHMALNDPMVSDAWTNLPAGYLDRARQQAQFGATRDYIIHGGDVGTSGIVPHKETFNRIQDSMRAAGVNVGSFMPRPTGAPVSPGVAFDPNQTIAALPPGAPGQVSAQSFMTPSQPSPQIGGAPWQYTNIYEPGRSAVPAQPNALPQGGQVMARDTGVINPTRTIPTTIEGTDPVTGARTSMPGPAAYTDQIQNEMRMRDQPITIAEKKPLTPQAAASPLKFPSIKRPQTRTIEGPSGNVSITDKGLDKGSVTTMMIGQAEEAGMPPDQFEREYAQHVIATKGEFPELDHQQLMDYKDRYFGGLVQQKTRELATAGITDPALIQQQAERIASGQMGNYIPSKGGGLVAFRPEEVQLSRITQATQTMNRELETAIRIVEAGGKYAPDFGHSFTDIIDSDTSMSPEQKQHIKVTATKNIAQRLIAKADPTDPFGRMKAMMVAANMTGGAVPPEWQQIVMGDPKSFGFSQAMADEYLTGKYNIWEKDGYARLQNAVADKAIQGQLVDQAIKNPERAGPLMQAAGDLDRGRTVQQALTGAGQAQLAQDVEQRRAESFAGVTGTKEAERIELVKQVATPLGEIGKALRRYLEMSYLNDPEGKAKAGKLYKDLLFAGRPMIAKGMTMQSGALNEQEQEAATSGWSSLLEADLSPESAMEKIRIINATLSNNFGRPVDILADDPLNPTVTQAFRFDRQGNPLGDTATRMATSPRQAVPGPQPTPGPQPVQPPTAVAGMQPMTRQQLGPLGTQQTGTTNEGRPIIQNPDGSVSTERTITVTDPRLNGGMPTNIPSMFGGKEVSEDEAVERIVRAGGKDPETGQVMKGYPTIDAAVKAAQERSAGLGRTIEQEVQSRKQATPSEASPKVGSMKGQPFTAPSNPQAVQAARAAIPDEVKRMIAAEPEFKERLRTAHQKYQAGEINRDELEREIVKVIGRLGSRRDARSDKGLLEGQALNAAVKALMDAYTGTAPTSQAGASR